MSQPATRSKAELLAALRSSGDATVATIEALPEAAFGEGRYENGWNARQILAHIASIEWTYARLLEIPGQAAATPPKNGALPTREAQGGMDAYNARQVERRAGASIAELIEELKTNRARTIAAVEEADETLLSQPIKSAGGRTGPLANVFYEVAVEHIREHCRDLAAA